MVTGRYPDDWVRNNLRQSFPPEQISTLPATAKRPPLDYVSHAAVTDRLGRIAPDWTWRPLEWVRITGADGLPHVLAVIGEMTVGAVTRVEVGAVDSPSSVGQEMKEAVSDFIRRGAMRFGVALDLWAKEDLASESTDASPQKTPSLGASDKSAITPASDGEGEVSRSGRGRDLPDHPVRGGEGPEPVVSVWGGGASPADTVIAGPSDWSAAARKLRTTKANTQTIVLDFFKRAGTPIRQVSEVDRDSLEWAVSSIQTARRTEVPTP